MSRQQEQIVRRANDLARILNVPAVTFAAREAEAYEIMAYAASIPLLKEKTKRGQLGGEVLLNASRAFPREPGRFTSDFHGVMTRVVIQMKEYPYWFSDLTQSNAELIQEYKTLLWMMWGLEQVGYTGWTIGFGTAARGGTRGWEAAAREGGGYADRLRGAGRGAIKGVKDAASGGMASRTFVAVWVVGQSAASYGKIRKAELEAELNRRYKDNKMTYEEYQEAFGVNIDPPEKYGLGG